MDRLGDIFFSRSSESLHVVMGFSLDRSGDRRMVNSSGLSSINLNLFSFGMDGRLNISFSDGELSWNVDVNSSGGGLVVNNSIFLNSLSINWSFYNFSSYNRSLYNSLSNNWLLNNSLGDDRLTNNFSGHNRFAFNSLSMSNNWFTI